MAASALASPLRLRTRPVVPLLGAALAVVLMALPPAGATTPTRTTVVAPATYHPGNWTYLAIGTPPGRQSGGFAWDPTLKEFVLFGGYDMYNNALNDTWTLRGGVWRNLTPTLPVHPPARYYAMMTWDAADHYILLYGGTDGTTHFNDTWVFTATGWTQLTPTANPGPLAGPAFADDLHDGYVMLFGGSTGSGQADQTWAYKGGVWTNLTAKVTGTPGPRDVNWATYDAGAKRVLLFGGYGSSWSNPCLVDGNTWTYVGGTFTNLSGGLSVAPPVASGARMMAFDPKMAGVVLYGGWDGPGCTMFSNETWVFHAGAWVQHVISPNPGPVWDGQLAAHGSTIVLFSGADIPYSSARFTQTWKFTP